MSDVEGPSKVLLYVYDLSNGFAAQLSQALIGKQIDGVWHTAVAVEGVEYFYGGGVQQAMAGTTPYGEPVDIIYLGETHIPREVLLEYIEELKKVFTPQAYNLFHHNCNNFSNELATFLTGSGIPEHITSLPADVLSTPMGQMLAPMLTGVESQLGSVQQGDSPLQLQSPLPGVTLPQYQPDPSSPATQPAAQPNASAAVAPSNSNTGLQAGAGAGSTPPGTAAGESTKQAGDRPAVATGFSKDTGRQTSAGAGNAQSAGIKQEGGSSREAAEEGLTAKAHFEELVRIEFAKAMAGGALSANEAAIQAVALARVRAESLDACGLGF